MAQDMSTTIDTAVEVTPTAPAAQSTEARDEKIAFAIIGLVLAALAGGFLTYGVAGVGIIAVALVPVLYVMLIIMAGGKG